MPELEWIWRVIILALLIWSIKTVWYDQRRAVDGKQDVVMCRQVREDCRELLAAKLQHLEEKIDRVLVKVNGIK